MNIVLYLYVHVTETSEPQILKELLLYVAFD